MIVAMPRINKESLRDQFNEAKQSAQDLAAAGKVVPEVQFLITTLLLMMEMMIAVFMEKTTKKTSKNSGIPPSETSITDDDQALQKIRNSKGKPLKKHQFSNSKTIETVEVIAVDFCDSCGTDLHDHPAEAVERRTRIDIYFEKKVEHQDIEIKTCPNCARTTKAKSAF